MIQRAFRYRLSPTPEQAETLAQFVGATRFVYNLCLEQRRDFWRQYRARTGGTLNFASQGREVTQLRAEVDWLRAVPSTALTQALRDLDRAFANFWSGRARYPTPRRKGINDSFRCQAKETGRRQINRRWGGVRIPLLGWLKYRNSRPIRGTPTNVTISRAAEGWFVSFACEIEHEAAPSALPAVGIDRGVANTLALSTGELLSTTATVRLERRRKRAQRTLARRVRGSNRYRKQRRRLAGIAAKIARIRADWRHKATTNIAQRFGTVALENLQTKNMVRTNRGLSRVIHEQGWRAFESVLAYKLEEKGGTLIKVNPAYSSQECSACGAVDRGSRKSQSSFVCTSCGTDEHADVNAAKVILRRSTPCLPVEAAGYGACEVGTINHALVARGC